MDHAVEYLFLLQPYTPPGLPSSPRAHKETTSKRSTTGSRQQPLRALHSLSLPSSTSPLVSNSSNEIRFYNRDEPYYEFTNFYPAAITVDGKLWPTSEHYFQAQKFVGTPYVEVVRKLKAPREAFQMSRDPKVSRWRRSDWESVKDDIMLKALLCKFTQYKKLQNKLLETGSKRLIEHTFNDSYWGDGGDGSGGNKLGQLLMQVRRKLEAVCGKPVTTPALTKRTESLLGSYGGSPSHRLKRSSSFSDLRTFKSEIGTGAETPSGYHSHFTKSAGKRSESGHVTPEVHTSSRATAYRLPKSSSKQHAKEHLFLSRNMPSGTGAANTISIPHEGRNSQSRARSLPPDPVPNSQSSRLSCEHLNRANVPSDNCSPITGDKWY